MIKDDRTHRAFAALQSGDRRTAALLFYRITKQEPHNQFAWLCLADCVDDRAEQDMFLHMAKTINPHSTAGQRAATRLSHRRHPNLPTNMVPPARWAAQMGEAIESLLRRVSARLRFPLP